MYRKKNSLKSYSTGRSALSRNLCLSSLENITCITWTETASHKIFPYLVMRSIFFPSFPWDLKISPPQEKFLCTTPTCSTQGKDLYFLNENTPIGALWDIAMIAPSECPHQLQSHKTLEAFHLQVRKPELKTVNTTSLFHHTAGRSLYSRRYGQL